MTIVPVRFSIMYYIIGNLTYSNSNNRNNALSAIQTVLAGYTTTDVTTSQPAGVNTSGTTSLTISVACNNEDVDAIRFALLTAWTSATRGTGAQTIMFVKVS